MNDAALVGVHRLQRDAAAGAHRLVGQLAGQRFQRAGALFTVVAAVDGKADIFALAAVSDQAGQVLDGIQRFAPTADDRADLFAGKLQPDVFLVVARGQGEFRKAHGAQDLADIRRGLFHLGPHLLGGFDLHRGGLGFGGGLFGFFRPGGLFRLFGLDGFFGSGRFFRFRGLFGLLGRLDILLLGGVFPAGLFLPAVGRLFVRQLHPYPHLGGQLLQPQKAALAGQIDDFKLHLFPGQPQQQRAVFNGGVGVRAGCNDLFYHIVLPLL